MVQFRLCEIVFIIFTTEAPYKIDSRALLPPSWRTGIFTVKCACPESFRGHHSYGLNNNDISWPEIDENRDIESNESLSGPNMDEAWPHGLVLRDLGNGRFSRLGTFEITKYYAGAYRGPTDSEADMPAWRSWLEKQ
jgi:hypothetical protein